MKKNILLTLGAVAVMAACTEDYKDWSTPMSTDTPEAIASLTSGENIDVTPETATIDFANLSEGQENVKVCSFSAPAPVSGVVKGADYIVLDSVITYELTADGEMHAVDLRNYVEVTYGRRPVERTVTAYVYTTYSNDTVSARCCSEPFVLTVKPEAPVIEQAYYFTGSINGWDNNNTDYKLTNDGSDPYENSTFKLRIPAPEDGSDVEFKMTPESGLGGDWSGCLSAGTEDGKFAYNNAGGNLKITAVPGAKFYDLTFEMLDQTWTYTAISFSDYIYLACDFNGWSTEASPLVHLGDGAYEGFYYIQEADEASTWGFKFVIDGSWSGGDHTKATAGSYELGGGGNLNCPTGFYQVKVNQVDATWTLTEVNTISLIGSAVNGDTSWGTDADMTFSTTEKCWIYEGPLTAGEFKFRMNHDWTISWGGTTFDNLTNQNGQNMKVESAGQYKVQFWPNCNGMGKCTLTPAN